MTNYNVPIYSDHNPCAELLLGMQYTCGLEPPNKTKAQNCMKRNSEIRGEFYQYSPCACIGCQYYVKSKGDGQYCSNSQAIWYLHSSGCSCDIKKPKSVTKPERGDKI